jgi:16S rRNA C967 or C1407 C5-methylase (RsmB/RsmF family)/NOL1/NOP2/fmu family ribosome biogenesis protein
MTLPEELLRSLRDLPGFSEEAFVAAHAQRPASRSIRVNPAKWDPASIDDAFASWFEDTSVQPRIVEVPWWKGGYGIEPRPGFTMDPRLHAGAYYVQEASSMSVGYALGQLLEGRAGLKALDLCASPGGKSTQLASLPQLSMLVSNETIRGRLPALYENIVKWGCPHVFVSGNDPSDMSRLPGFFDVMVVDAPCSGSGLFRREPEALGEWSPAHVELCSRRQRRILSDALPALAEGGLLLYSTCSFSPEEDEEVLDWLVTEKHMRSERLDMPADWGVIETVSPKAGAFGYRFHPDRLQGEGFFLACLTKTEGSYMSPKNPVGRPKGRIGRPADAERWVRDPESLSFDVVNDDVFAFPAGLVEDRTLLMQSLALRKSGTRVGRLVRDRIVPDHELAMSLLLHPAIPSVELDRSDALRYLSKEDVFPESAEKGWKLVTHHDLPLGFLNRLPNRANNAYPSEWRIRARRV